MTLLAKADLSAEEGSRALSKSKAERVEQEYSVICVDRLAQADKERPTLTLEPERAALVDAVLNEY